MDEVVGWLIVAKPFWYLAAWLASSVFAAFVAMEKNRCMLCWFAMGVLFGPLALITTVGLPVKPPRPPVVPTLPGAANAAGVAHAHASGQASAHSHAHAHAAAAHAHAPAHAPLASAHHTGPIPPPLGPVHPAHAPAAHAAAAHHPAPAQAAGKSGFLDSTLEKPAGIAIVAILILLLLGYFASRYW
jgi:hypothetical protein